MASIFMGNQDYHILQFISGSFSDSSFQDRGVAVADISGNQIKSVNKIYMLREAHSSVVCLPRVFTPID